LYSITTEATFQEVHNLRDKLVNITDHDNLPVVLVGNKSDLESDREVETAAGKALADSFNWRFMEASAKTKTNVVEAFEEIVRCIRSYRTNDGGAKEDDNSTGPTTTKPKKNEERYLHALVTSLLIISISVNCKPRKSEIIPLN